MSVSEAAEIDVIERRVWRRPSISVLVGLVAIVVAFVGIGALHALQQPPRSSPQQPPLRSVHGRPPCWSLSSWSVWRCAGSPGPHRRSVCKDDVPRAWRGSVLDMMVRWSLWSNLYEGLMSATTRRRIVPPGSGVITVIAAVGVGLACIAGLIGRPGESSDAHGRPDDDQAARVSTLRWQTSLGLVVIGLIALTIAQHASGGGNAHARSAMPAIGVAAVLLVIGMSRAGPTNDESRASGGEPAARHARSPGAASTARSGDRQDRRPRGDRFVLDEAQARKRPDWTYEPTRR